MHLLFYLPNRVYYPQLSAVSAEDLQVTIVNVLIYASMEFASFIILCVMLKCNITISGVHQLAFVLETYSHVVLSKLVLWIVFMLQSTLQRFGKSSCISSLYPFSCLDEPVPCLVA